MEKQNQPALSQNKLPMKKKLILAFGSVLTLVLVFLVGYFSVEIIKTKNQTKKMGQNIQSTFNPEDALKNLQNLRDKYSFPKFEYAKSDYKPSLPDYTINLDELKNLGSFEKKSQDWSLNPITLSDSIKQTLKQNNFFITQNTDNYFGEDPKEDTTRIDDWTDLYGDIGGSSAPQDRLPENSVFVSSDFMLHVYHRLIDKEFKYIEQKNFYPSLKKITDTMLKASIDAYNNSNLASKKESYQRLIAYFAVPDAILNSSYGFYKSEAVGDDSSDSREATLANLDAMKDKIPAGAYDSAKQEIGLIMDADQIQESPLFGKYLDEISLSFPEDYTQYGPRSHYGENPTLRTYWRTMMWYGRQNFVAKSPELTRDAMNIVLLMNQFNLMKDWENIYVPTSFFVGESDDLGIYDYQKVLTENKDTPPGDELVAKIQQDIANLPNPKIMSSVAIGDQVVDSTKEELQNKTKGFRFMGQRFTPDAFIFSSLTQGDEKPDPKTGEKLPSMPTALMVMSALGNKTADQHLNDWISTNASDSKNVLADRMISLKQYFGALSTDLWTQNIYWSWLYTLQALSQEGLDKTGYPNFMKNTDWDNKNLQCSLGSWTELKHDTLLYAKQSYAEMGGGGPEGDIPPVPKGYVEPNIEFLDRLIPFVKMTEDGLKQRGILDDEFIGRNESLLKALSFFRKIAIAEVNNEKISDDDFEKLRLMAGNLGGQILSPLPNEQRTEDLARSALIADVHTDVPGKAILYEADGIPNYIYVAVKDDNGTRMTKGLVYSYYEFKNPIEKRLTDTDWKEWVYTKDASKMPNLPDWSQALMK
jgi:hypothetical protein